jgi:hypothetical protein
MSIDCQSTSSLTSRNQLHSSSQNYPPILHLTSWSFSSSLKKGSPHLRDTPKAPQSPLASRRSFPNPTTPFYPAPTVSRHRLFPSSIRLHPLSSIPAAFSLVIHSTHSQIENNHALHAVVMGRRKNKTAKSIRPRTQDHPSVHTGLTTYFRITPEL